MSEAWGPRAHPARCCEDVELPDQRPPRRSYEESLGTAFVVLLVTLVLAGAVLWWVR